MGTKTLVNLKNMLYKFEYPAKKREGEGGEGVWHENDSEFWGGVA